MAGALKPRLGRTPTSTLSPKPPGSVCVPCQCKLLVLEAWKQLGKLVASLPGYGPPSPPPPLTVSQVPKAPLTEVSTVELNILGSIWLRKINSTVSPSDGRKVGPGEHTPTCVTRFFGSSVQPWYP